MSYYGGSTRAQIKRAKRKLKQLRAKINKSKDKLNAHKRNTAAKYSRSNPGAYIPASEWKKLTPEEMDAARKARQTAGIPTRSVGALSTKSNKQEEDMEIVDLSGTSNISQLKQVPPHLLKAPPKGGLVTSQRQAMYAKTKRSSDAKSVARQVVALTRNLGGLKTSG